MKLTILLLGSGGREHALAWKLAQSPLVQHIYCVPGNGGTASLGGTVSNVTDVPIGDFESILRFATDKNVNLLLPGPEDPLVNGVVDYFKEHGPARIACFGPTRDAARMEGDKAFAKEFMKQHNIPTARYESFEDFEKAEEFLKANQHVKWVLKATGLAAGKGVIIPETHDDAVKALHSMMVDREFGAAGDTVVIEERLEGEEISILSFCDGFTFQSLPPAQDHKRINDNDEGPNTGGMGCYAPTKVVTAQVLSQIDRQVLAPTLQGMRKEGMPFVGCLFTGFMMTRDGPKVLEYNVRFGDPETQTLLPLMESDLAEVLLQCTRGCLDSLTLQIQPQSSTTVVVAAGGYPGKYDKGTPIKVSDVASPIVIFHAGTTRDAATSSLKTSGGRVIAATATAPTIQEAVQKAYAGVSQIEFDGMHYRHDIARRELDRKVDATPKDQSPLTYASAGVSINAGNSLVSRIKSLVKSTARPGAGAEIGGFGGDVSLREAGYGDDAPRLVCAIDGIGTKMIIAQAMRKLDTIGIDLVAMNVNDVVVQGAEPLAFLDYYACSKLDVDDCAAFVAGVAEGCRQAGCALVGGETAEMPGLYSVGDFDAAGCAIGAIPQSVPLLPRSSAMQAGDVLIGLGSSGPHSNGFSLIRKIVEREGLSYDAPAPWDVGTTLGDALLTPTKIYVKSLLSAIAMLRQKLRHNPILAAAHITGGGLVENIPRALPPNLDAVVQCGSWPVPASLKWLWKKGNLDGAEFAKTFNAGLGMVLVVERAHEAVAIETLQRVASHVFLVGHLAESEQGVSTCILAREADWTAQIRDS